MPVGSGSKRFRIKNFTERREKESAAPRNSETSVFAAAVVSFFLIFLSLILTLLHDRFAID